MRYKVCELSKLIPRITSEISQEGNINAYTRLFVLDDAYIAKIGYKNWEMVEKNISNLKWIWQHISFNAFPELTLPVAFVEHGKKIVGYVMPYVRGNSLAQRLRDPSISSERKIEWFNQLGDVIQRLPESVHIGDLHGNNVLIDSYDNIHLIDVDGFSIDEGYTLTCPLHFEEGLMPDICIDKYFYSDGRTKIGKNSDIYCLLSLFFQHLFDGINPFYFPLDWIEKFLHFLECAGISDDAIRMCRRITESEDNFLGRTFFESFKSPNVKISYSLFLQESKLCEVEYRAEEYLRNIGDNTGLC